MLSQDDYKKIVAVFETEEEEKKVLEHLHQYGEILLMERCIEGYVCFVKMNEEGKQSLAKSAKAEEAKLV